MTDPALRPLFASLSRRPRPEDAARLILDAAPDGLTATQRVALETAAAGRRRGRAFTPMPSGGFFTAAGGGPGGSGRTSLPGGYARPVGAGALLATAREVDGAGPFFAAAPPTDAADPDAIGRYLAAAEPEIGKAVGASDFRTDRLNRFERRDARLGLTKAQYNRRWRLAKRLERKAATLRRVTALARLERVSHTALADRLSYGDFAADPPAARFVAYHAARCGLRSVFTAGRQTRPFDRVGAALLDTVGAVDARGWWAAAHVFPDPAVLARLPADRLAALLGRFREELLFAAGVLRDLWAGERLRPRHDGREVRRRLDLLEPRRRGLQPGPGGVVRGRLRAGVGGGPRCGMPRQGVAADGRRRGRVAPVRGRRVVAGHPRVGRPAAAVGRAGRRRGVSAVRGGAGLRGVRRGPGPVR